MYFGNSSSSLSIPRAAADAIANAGNLCVRKQRGDVLAPCLEQGSMVRLALASKRHPPQNLTGIQGHRGQRLSNPVTLHAIQTANSLVQRRDKSAAFALAVGRQ